MSTRARSHQPAHRPKTDRLALNDEESSSDSPSFFEWREKTIRTQAFKPTPPPRSKGNVIVRLLRMFT